MSNFNNPMRNLSLVLGLSISVLFMGNLSAAVPQGYMLSEKPPVTGRAGQGINGRETWRLNNYQDYAYTIEQTCYCILPKHARVFVLNDQVVQVNDLKSGKVHTEPEMLGLFKTMNGYFKLIDEQVAAQPDHMQIRLNRKLGYPEQIIIDRSYRMADEEINYRISDFRFLQKK